MSIVYSCPIFLTSQNVHNAGALCRWYFLDPTYKIILKTMNCCSKSGRQGGFFHHRGTNNLLRFFKKSTTTIKLLPLLVWVSMWWCLVYRVDQKICRSDIKWCQCKKTLGTTIQHTGRNRFNLFQISFSANTADAHPGVSGVSKDQKFCEKFKNTHCQVDHPAKIE